MVTRGIFFEYVEKLRTALKFKPNRLDLTYNDSMNFFYGKFLVTTNVEVKFVVCLKTEQNKRQIECNIPRSMVSYWTYILTFPFETGSVLFQIAL